MDPELEYVFRLLDTARLDTESFTYLVVTGGSRTSVLTALGADLDRNVDPDELEFDEGSAYAAVEVNGGVIAIEHTGYADPNNKTLALLSADGGAAAVARSNIQAHERFGCARDGALVFDDHEFMYVESEVRERVPPELRPIFDYAWVDLDVEDDDEDKISGLYAAMAMATLFTGVRVTTEDLHRAKASTYHQVRTLAYLD